MIVLFLYRYNSLYCYDTDDMTLEKTTMKEVKQLAKNNRELFDNITKTGEIKIIRSPRTIKNTNKIPELTQVDENTLIWFSSSLSRIFIFSYEMCYCTRYVGANISNIMPVIYKDNIYISSLGNITLLYRMYYLGDYSYKTLRRQIVLKGDSFINKVTSEKGIDNVYGVQIISGTPRSYDDILRELR